MDINIRAIVDFFVDKTRPKLEWTYVKKWRDYPNIVALTRSTLIPLISRCVKAPVYLDLRTLTSHAGHTLMNTRAEGNS